MSKFSDEMKQHAKNAARSAWRRTPWQYKPIVLIAGVVLVLYIVQGVVSLFV